MTQFTQQEAESFAGFLMELDEKMEQALRIKTKLFERKQQLWDEVIAEINDALGYGRLGPVRSYSTAPFYQDYKQQVDRERNMVYTPCINAMKNTINKVEAIKEDMDAVIGEIRAKNPAFAQEITQLVNSIVSLVYELYNRLTVWDKRLKDEEEFSKGQKFDLLKQVMESYKMELEDDDKFIVNFQTQMETLDQLKQTLTQDQYLANIKSFGAQVVKGALILPEAAAGTAAAVFIFGLMVINNPLENVIGAVLAGEGPGIFTKPKQTTLQKIAGSIQSAASGVLDKIDAINGLLDKVKNNATAYNKLKTVYG